LLRGIRRRARPDRVFVAGSGGPDLRPWFDLAGTVIARHARWQVASLGGDAGWWTTRRVGIQRREDNVYDAEALRLYFRRKDGSPPPEMPERIGTAVFTDEGRHPLVDKVVDGCRAIVVVGGGARTREEVQIAHAAGLGVVPVAASGGAAREVWENACATGLPRLGGYPPPATVWERLADPERDQVEQAVETLLQQAMYW
jgi:hypothetical protein